MCYVCFNTCVEEIFKGMWIDVYFLILLRICSKICDVTLVDFFIVFALWFILEAVSDLVIWISDGTLRSLNLWAKLNSFRGFELHDCHLFALLPSNIKLRSLFSRFVPPKQIFKTLLLSAEDAATGDLKVTARCRMRRGARTISERRVVECSLRLMTPSPSWCLFRRLEKVLSSLSTFCPESTLASSFQNGSL